MPNPLLILAILACGVTGARTALANGGTLTVTPSPGNPNHVVTNVHVTNTTCLFPSQCDPCYVNLVVTPCPPGKPCVNGSYRSHTVFPNVDATSVDESFDLAPGVAYRFEGLWQLVSFLWFPPEMPTCFPMCSIGGDLNPVEYAASVSVATTADAIASLGPARPNPFRTSAAFELRLARDGAVRVGVYDLGGRLVRLLLDGHRVAGSIPLRWDARDERGVEVDAGLYLVRSETAGVVSTRTVIRIR